MWNLRDTEPVHECAHVRVLDMQQLVEEADLVRTRRVDHLVRDDLCVVLQGPVAHVPVTGSTEGEKVEKYTFGVRVALSVPSASKVSFRRVRAAAYWDMMPATTSR